MGELLKAVLLSWEEKFGHGYPPGSAILSSVLLSTSKCGHSFRPESVGDMLDAVILPWDGILGHNVSSDMGGDAYLAAR